MKRGWIRVHRQVQDHWLWRGERFSRGQAWMDLLLEANYEDRQVRLGNQFITVKRGQALVSQRKLVNRWGWARNTVARFLRVLKVDQMLSLEVSHGPEGGYTLITVLNYEQYQGSKEEDNKDRLSHALSDERDTLGTRLEPYLINKEVKKERKEPSSPFFNEQAFRRKFPSQDLETMKRGKIAGGRVPTDGFDLFRAEYPVHRFGSVKKAKEQFPGAVKRAKGGEVLIASVKAHRKHPEWQKENGKYIPHAFRWLRDDRWQDIPLQQEAEVMATRRRSQVPPVPDDETKGKIAELAKEMAEKLRM